MPCCRQRVAVNVKAELVPCQVSPPWKAWWTLLFSILGRNLSSACSGWSTKAQTAGPRGVGFLFLFKSCHICRESFSPVTLPRRNQDSTGCLMTETRRGKKTALIPVKGVARTESSKFATSQSALILGYPPGTKAAALSCLIASWEA